MGFRFAIFLLIFLSTTLFSYHKPSFAQESVISVFPTPTSVQYILPYPGILPDHPLYFLKKWRDSILLFFTRDPLKKTQLYLLLGDKKLVMFSSLWADKKLDLSLKTLEEGESNLLTSSSILVNLKRNNTLPSGLDKKLILSAKKHEEIITATVNSSNDLSLKSQLTDILRLTHQANQQIASFQ